MTHMPPQAGKALDGHISSWPTPWHEQVVVHVAELAAVTIDPDQLDFTAGHAAPLTARWLHHAFQIAALDTAAQAYAAAASVLRACPYDQIDTTIGWLNDLGKQHTAVTAEMRREICLFRQASQRLKAIGLVIHISQPPTASSEPQVRP